MKIMAFDTSAKTASVCVAEDGALLGELNTNTKFTHSQTLLPMAQSLLNCLSLSFSDMDCFAVSTGPGSFTGLRIGIGAVKGLAYGLNRPCAGVSTLDALSRNLSGADGIVCPVMDARCGQVYTALFESTPGTIVRTTEDMAISIEELSKRLQKEKKNVFLVGDGAELCYNNLKDRVCHVYLASNALRYQRASGVAAAAERLAASGQTVPAARLVPVYLRLPQAERERLKKQQAMEENHV